MKTIENHLTAREQFLAQELRISKQQNEQMATENAALAEKNAALNESKRISLQQANTAHAVNAKLLREMQGRSSPDPGNIKDLQRLYSAEYAKGRKRGIKTAATGQDPLLREAKRPKTEDCSLFQPIQSDDRGSPKLRRASDGDYDGDYKDDSEDDSEHGSASTLSY